jgi:hypothetical protein
VIALGRAEIGIRHHIAGPYVMTYAREMAGHENSRRASNIEQHFGCGRSAPASGFALVEGLLAEPQRSPEKKRPCRGL